ncbi:MAG: branched-chain amino acid ABC transporter permease [Acidimicrobiia bacterium]|nr:branched-chain amino acid ABC transporter permease [Acidimicrobiia bacterium]
MILGVALAQPAVFGIVNGAAFGLVAIGLVMIYKSSRVFNFAAGEFVTLGAFGAYIGVKILGLPYFLAAVLGIAAGTAFGLVTERLVVRPLADRPKVTVLVATAAIATIAIPLELMIGGVKTFPARPAFQNGVSVAGVKIISRLGPSVFGVRVSPQLLLIMVSLIAIGVILVWFFGRTDLGLATLATSQEPTAGRLVGIRLNRISMLTWGAAGFLGGMGGVLLAPVTATFTAGYGTVGVLISAFTAAVVGGMTSIPGAFLGGILVGLVQTYAQFDLTKVTGASSVAVLVMLVAVLLIRPTGILGKEA